MLNIQQQQQLSKNYFVSIDFILRAILFLIAVIIIILQHVLILCKSKYHSIDTFIYEYFTPSFGTNSWSATGLYVTCWAIIILYIHTILIVFMDNFQIQFYATTFVIQDTITSICFLAWTTMNIIQLSNCSKRELASNRNETERQFEIPFCGLVPCSIYLAPSIGSFLVMFVAISLAVSAFRKINFYKISHYIRDYDSIRSPNISSNNKQYYPLPDIKTIHQQQSTESDSNQS